MPEPKGALWEQKATPGQQSVKKQKAGNEAQLLPCHAGDPGFSCHHYMNEWYACNPSTREVETRRSKVQGYPQLYVQFEASLGYMRSILHARVHIHMCAHKHAPRTELCPLHKVAQGGKDAKCG